MHAINLYPNIRKFALDVALCNGMINRLEPEAEFLTKCDQALFADGVYIEDVGKLEDWLGTLTPEQFETLSDGEAYDMDGLIAGSPSTDEGEKLITILDDVFGF